MCHSPAFAHCLSSSICAHENYNALAGINACIWVKSQHDHYGHVISAFDPVHMHCDIIQLEAVQLASCCNLQKHNSVLCTQAMALYDKLGVKKHALTLIHPQFEAPLPPLQPAVFPPAIREPPPPALELFDLD